MRKKKNEETNQEAQGESKVPDVQVPGFVCGTTVGEMVINKEGKRYFMVRYKGAIKVMDRHRAPSFYHVPIKDPLAGNIVHFAQDAAFRYTAAPELLKQIKEYLHRYVEMPLHYEDISALYVLLTWVYEFAPSIPYLRVIGDWGSGKTRFLQVVGSICFRPIFASGAVTPSPIFRLLDKYRGTLVLDEADFKDTSAWAEMVKILNNGYRPGFPVLRSDKSNERWHAHGYHVFGPKLIATRHQFADEALESRCLTTEMLPLMRQDIQLVLPAAFQEEINELRCKLLTFRLHNLFRLKGCDFTNDLIEPGLTPRLQEVLIPLKALALGDEQLSEVLKSFIQGQQEALFFADGRATKAR